jgi:hypothetical protein
MNPETPDTTFPVIIERWKSREELRREYLDSLSPEELRQVNPADYWVKYGRPAFEREQARKYDPDQPRVPAGNPDGGQWTSESSGSESATDDTSATAEVLSRVFDAARDDANSSPVMSDESSDPLIPGARYAQVAVSRFDRTGDPRIDNTTGTLMETLARAHTSVGEGAGPVYGIMVHSAFGADVKRQDIPGIGREGVEQSFSLGDISKYGLDGTIRTDVVLRDAQSPDGKPIAIWDVKTGDARLSGSRVQEIRDQVRVGSDVPVIELHIRRGVTTKARLGQLGSCTLIAALVRYR